MDCISYAICSAECSNTSVDIIIVLLFHLVKPIIELHFTNVDDFVSSFDNQVNLCFLLSIDWGGPRINLCNYACNTQRLFNLSVMIQAEKFKCQPCPHVMSMGAYLELPECFVKVTVGFNEFIIKQIN